MSSAQPSPELPSEIKSRLDEIVQSEPVVLFMKGSRTAPQCGFSATVVDILNEHLETYRTVDVLLDNTLREGIKLYSDWPTIPQLYLGGEFVGGADIIKEMNSSGELKTALGEASKKGPSGSGPAKEAPSITFTETAARTALDSRDDGDGPYLRLEISPDFEHGLAFDMKGPDDFVVEVGHGLTVIVDPWSASRANGLSIDFVEEGERAGFKIDNPNPKGGKVAPTDAAAPAMSTEPPAFAITPAAMKMFQDAIAEEEGPGPWGIRVLAKRMGATKADYELDIISGSEKAADAIEIDKDGLIVWVDPFSARNLDGASIDFVTGDRGSGFKFDNPRLKEGWSDPRADHFEQLLEREINPSIASHGGVVHLCDVQGDTAWVQMGGGCQGCGMAGVTLNQGIVQRVREVIPSIQHVVDLTDHASGTNPYYAPKS
jgi:Grx4 family monothiol glutaredoxin